MSSTHRALTQHQDGALRAAAALLLGSDGAPGAIHQVLDLIRILALSQDLRQQPGWEEGPRGSGLDSRESMLHAHSCTCPALTAPPFAATDRQLPHVPSEEHLTSKGAPGTQTPPRPFVSWWLPRLHPRKRAASRSCPTPAPTAPNTAPRCLFSLPAATAAATHLHNGVLQHRSAPQDAHAAPWAAPQLSTATWSAITNTEPQLRDESSSDRHSSAQSTASTATGRPCADPLPPQHRSDAALKVNYTAGRSQPAAQHSAHCAAFLRSHMGAGPPRSSALLTAGGSVTRRGRAAAAQRHRAAEHLQALLPCHRAPGSPRTENHSSPWQQASQQLWCRDRGSSTPTRTGTRVVWQGWSCPCQTHSRGSAQAFLASLCSNSLQCFHSTTQKTEITFLMQTLHLHFCLRDCMSGAVCFRSWQRSPQPSSQRGKRCLLTPAREKEDGSYQKSPYRVLIKWVYSMQRDICQPGQPIVQVHQSEAVNARCS